MIRKADKKTEIVAARLPVEMHKRLLKCAKRKQEKPSDIIRRALASYFVQN